MIQNEFWWKKNFTRNTSLVDTNTTLKLVGGLYPNAVVNVTIPFGTGNLYENILNINKKEVITDTHDPRFKGNPEILRRCNYFGATANDPKSKVADSLYSPHLPFAHYNEQWIRLYRQAGYCGSLSDVHIVQERFIDEALTLAKQLNITCEPSAMSGLALMLQLKDSLPRDKKMLVVSTGKAHLPKNKNF